MLVKGKYLFFPLCVDYFMTMMSDCVCIEDINFSMPNADAEEQDVMVVFGTLGRKRGKRLARYSVDEVVASVMA